MLSTFMLNMELFAGWFNEQATWTNPMHNIYN